MLKLFLKLRFGNMNLGICQPSKNVTSFYFDSENPPESVVWVQMDSSADTWTLFVDGSMVPDTLKQERHAVFSSISKLKGTKTQTGKFEPWKRSLISTIMNQSPGVNSGQRLRCFISWKRVASARSQTLAVAVMLHHLRSHQAKKQKKSGSKTKKVSSFYFDSATPPQSVCWVQTDTSADTWTPYCNGGMVPGNRKQEWDAVFSTVSKLKQRNTHTGR